MNLNTMNINLNTNQFQLVEYSTQSIEYCGFLFRKTYNKRIYKYFAATICGVEIVVYYNDIAHDWNVGFKDYTDNDGLIIRPPSEPIFTHGTHQAGLKYMLDQFFDQIFSGKALARATEYRKVCDDNISLLNKFKDLSIIKDILE